LIASSARGRVLAFAFLLALVTYLDRVCISAAAPAIMDDLHLSFLQMSVVFSAFTLAYSLFEVPSGWLGDVKGPRSVLTRIVLWWSGFTMLTGAAHSFPSLVAIRFLFGAGEAGAFPNVARAFSSWFPIRERGRANGVLFLGSRLGGMLSAPAALFLVARWGWRASFLVFGSLGLIWAATWHRWFRDRPEDHRDVGPDEIAWIRQDRVTQRLPAGNSPGHPETGGAEGEEAERTPWRELLAGRNLYAICAMYFAFGYGLYFYFTWLPTYLISVLGFSRFSGGLFAALPFLLAGAADLVGGALTDHLSQTRGRRVGRCYLGCASFGAGALFLAASTIVRSPVADALLIACALASADLALGACWAVPLDIAPDHAGVITGCMNTLGNLGGLVGPLVVGFAVDRWRSWVFPFYVTAGVYAFGALAWLLVDPESRATAPKVAARASWSPARTSRPAR